MLVAGRQVLVYLPIIFNTNVFAKKQLNFYCFNLIFTVEYKWKIYASSLLNTFHFNSSLFYIKIYSFIHYYYICNGIYLVSSAVNRPWGWDTLLRVHT